ncbi:MAG: hypothetical protein WD794_16315 [Mycobacteriales bacterium]
MLTVSRLRGGSPESLPAAAADLRATQAPLRELQQGSLDGGLPDLRGRADGPLQELAGGLHWQVR